MRTFGAAVEIRAEPRNRRKFLEYLASDEAQRYFAVGNNEYPIAGDATGNPALDALGPLRPTR